MRSQLQPSSRRDFLKKLSVGITAGALPIPLYDMLPKKGDKMQLGLVTYLWGKDWDVPALITNCTKTKVLGLELRVDHAHKISPSLSKAEREEVKKQFDDSKVTVLGMGTNQSYHHVDQTRLKKEIEGTKDYIILSHDIGGTGVKVKPNALPAEVAPEKTIEQIGLSLNEVGKMAADYGQEIRVEVHGKKTQELPNMKAIFDHVDQKNVTVCWNCNPQDLIGEGLDYNFNLVKDRFGDTVHVREFNVGDYPYQQLMDLFVEMDYQGWILLECRTKPEDKVKAMKEQRKIWKKMIKNAQKKR